MRCIRGLMGFATGRVIGVVCHKVELTNRLKLCPQSLEEEKLTGITTKAVLRHIQVPKNRREALSLERVLVSYGNPGLGYRTAFS